MLLDRPCRPYEVHDFDAFYVYNDSVMEAYKIPDKGERNMHGKKVLPFKHPTRFWRTIEAASAA